MGLFSRRKYDQTGAYNGGPGNYSGNYSSGQGNYSGGPGDDTRGNNTFTDHLGRNSMRNDGNYGNNTNSGAFGHHQGLNSNVTNQGPQSSMANDGTFGNTTNNNLFGHHNTNYGRHNNVMYHGTHDNMTNDVNYNNNTNSGAFDHHNNHHNLHNNHSNRGMNDNMTHHGMHNNIGNDGTYDNRPKRGLLSRRNKHHNTRDHDNHHREERPLFDMESGNFNRRPSFGQWLKMTWLDILTMAIMGVIGLGVYEAHPAPSRSFPVTFSNGEIVYPEFAYPLRNEIVPIWEAALLGSLVPIAVILLMQIRIRSFWDTNNAIIGLLYSLIAAAVFQVFIKWLIGGLRPHFLSVCNPDPALVLAGGKGFGSIMFQRNICRGDIDQIDDSLESMPSGHSTAAWAGFLYLYYYLNAKLKVFANYHPAFWKLIALYAPLLGAFLITGALTIDEFHNWYDCLAGAIIGSVMATSAYRMVYASVFDFRFNHIPLTRHTPFSFGAGEAGAGGFETAVFTHAGGWGYEEALGGAPFDAAHGLRGQLAGFNTSTHNNDRNHGHGEKQGLGYSHKKSDDIEHHAATTRGNVADAGAGIVTGTGTDSRYHHHSRSMERKAIPTTGTGVENRRSGDALNNRASVTGLDDTRRDTGFDNRRSGTEFDNRTGGVRVDKRDRDTRFDNWRNEPGLDNRRNDTPFDDRTGNTGLKSNTTHTGLDTRDHDSAFDNRRSGTGFDNNRQSDTGFDNRTSDTGFNNRA